jgi:hypothetical protein
VGQALCLKLMLQALLDLIAVLREAASRDTDMNGVLKGSGSSVFSFSNRVQIVRCQGL